MNKHDEYDVAEPSRRQFVIERVGALGAFLGRRVSSGRKTAKCARYALSPDARMETQPFYGEHQAGILTPQQASMMLVAFDSLASDKADLERLFRLLTTRIAFLTAGDRRQKRQTTTAAYGLGILGRSSPRII